MEGMVAEEAGKAGAQVVLRIPVGGGVRAVGPRSAGMLRVVGTDKAVAAIAAQGKDRADFPQLRCGPGTAGSATKGRWGQGRQRNEERWQRVAIA